MYSEFCKYVKRERLLEGRSRLLLAVSGGVDSVVLTDLMCRYAAEHGGVELSLAHCNFHLRGEESDRDEKFVRALAARYGLPLYVEEFDTVKHAEKFGQSIEMAARELRYLFFSKLMVEQKMDACLLAHHADDNAETFFINLFRGSGVKGLRGMLPCSWKTEGRAYVYLRPLLWARRAQILQYASQRGLSYVEDSTNAEQNYLRNKIRHSVLPLLEQVSEGSTEKLTQSMETLRRVDALLDDWYKEQKDRVVKFACDADFLPADALASLGNHVELFLELYLRKHAFNRAQIERILENHRSGISGKSFENTDGTRVFIRGQNGWILATVHPKMAALNALKSAMAVPPPVREREVFIPGKEAIDPSPRKAYLNFGKLRFPLTWRHPQAGDRFKPLGTKGFKKLSDFFKDEKIDVYERQAAWLLCSGDDIVWVAGYRIDDRYKITPPAKAWVVEI